MPLTNWNNEPSIQSLKIDLSNSTTSHSTQVTKINAWLEKLEAKPLPKRKGKPRSTIVPKLVRKQAEWRYASLSEPFLSTPNIFKVNPVSYEDGYSARQNELVLNHQFNTQINKIKFIDDYVRSAVDTGTAILRVDWVEQHNLIDVPTPQYQLQPVDPSDVQASNRFERIQRMFSDSIYSQNVPMHWVDALQRANDETQAREQQVMQQMQVQLMEAQRQGLPPEQIEQLQQQLQEQLQQLPPIMYEPIQVGSIINQEEQIINKPQVSVIDYHKVYIDPTCEGELDRAEFVIYVFNSCKGDLIADGRYKNVEQIPDDAGVDHSYSQYDYDDTLTDPARKKLTVYEYWGNWDINGDGTKVPIVATWVGDVMIRLEENPYPDHKPPFVIVPYLPVTNKVYGEPDGALIGDNQDIIGAITRGMIDTLGSSANAQTAIQKDALDSLNMGKFVKGEDFMINPGVPANQAIYQFTYPELPQTPLVFIQSQQAEAEALTGVKAYSEGITGNSLGDTASGVRSVLDAASKREMGILRRLADGLKKVARKIIAMNALWLNDSEVIRITNEDFVEIHRDDLAGNFDLELAISSAEEDTMKAESLAFMLQTLGNTVDQGITQMILSTICDLRKMPELAERIRRYTPPEPDPIQQQIQQLQIETMQAQLGKLQAEIQNLQAQAQYNGAKAQSEMVEAEYKPQEVMGRAQGEMAKANYTNVMARKLDQEYMDNIAGIQHQRDMELMGAQAKAQLDKSLQEASMKYGLESRKLDQKDAEMQYKREEALLKHRAEMAKIKNQNKNKKGTL